MTPTQPLPFLTALHAEVLSAGPDAALQTAKDWAEAQGCTVHILGRPAGTAPQIAALQAAGARAIAASLLLGGAPLLLIATGQMEAPAGFSASLTQGLQGYERIHALVAPLNAQANPVLISPTGQVGGDDATGPLFWAILILAPDTPNSYWQPKT